VEAPDVIAAPARSKIIRMAAWWVGPLAAAACVVFGVNYLRHEAPPVEPRAEEYVARVTGSKACKWATGPDLARADKAVRKGQRLELESGYAEITFDSGAQVVLEGRASLAVNSAWDATLLRGTLKANVPAEAMGFRVSSPSVEVVNLGTEFTMIADSSGAADVLVLKGMIEASSRDSSEQRTIVLRENQSRHFAQSGVSNVSDPEEKFAKVSRTVSLDHFAPATLYVHWSFDEEGGDILKADSYGLPLEAYNARLDQVSDGVLNSVRTEGRWQRGLRFNGHLYAKADVPRLSGNSAHTVAFWVKVPDDARLPNAYAMVGWGVSSPKLGSHPVHIGWNRNPTEGTVGVLRTDYGGGFALGATPLRDGRWHHVAIVFVPGEDLETPVEVKQYVNGRFEGEGKPSPPGTEISVKFNEQNTTAMRDTLWLGCRLGNNGPRKDRFRGELDELCIADRALGPREIVWLMKENKPPPTESLAANQ